MSTINASHARSLGLATCLVLLAGCITTPKVSTDQAQRFRDEIQTLLSDMEMKGIRIVKVGDDSIVIRSYVDATVCAGRPTPNMQAQTAALARSMDALKRLNDDLGRGVATPIIVLPQTGGPAC